MTWEGVDSRLNFRHEGGGSPFGEVLYYIFFPLYASEVATLAMTEKEKGDII